MNRNGNTGTVARTLRQIYRNYPFLRGRSRLFALAMRQVHGYTLAQDQLGNTYVLDLDSLISSYIYLTGAYEPELIKLFVEQAERFGCRSVIDIGANIGVYTLACARASCFEHIYAFEPDPRNRAFLQANLVLNDFLDRVTVYDCALSNTDGTASFRLERKAYSDIWGKTNASNSRFAPPDENENPYQTVPMRRLDALYEFNGQSLAIKLDVEGFEKSVLEGMENTLRNNRCILLVEIYPANFTAVDSLLSSFGYRKEDLALEDDNYLYVAAAK